MLLHTELSATETVIVAMTMLRSFLPVTWTIRSPITSVMPEWNRAEPTTIMPIISTILLPL
uniref:hypothetical protein n=1 Tax=Pyramidobacter sp. CG50-2 TaxID=2382160 RepID=UPI001F2AC1B4|nr:hypothetical protein [Pyramidobacter sp. CG50-2]